ncbi:Metal tolerance protein 8 [Gracilariopsis chorda]|uniref:Metal tolerance protein 8 n=1 Tax=Gracilariopsis chorda TaxID=448386 RepID=A0A2V3IY71_9FLOR|nr:Metal tolerance protein 8 [Gracilariopsis chorda]|eukprot:PXF46627.1 Metal tolerance protein 8 [Gracilariopsis chorda]
MPVVSLSSSHIYATFTLVFTTLLLQTSIHDDHPHAIARASLQFLTALALLPVCKRPQQPKSLTARWPVLAAFLLCLTLLIDAVLRVLTALEVLLYNLPRVIFQSHFALVLARLLVTCFAMFALRTLAAPPTSKHTPPRSPAIRAMYIHAVGATLANASDLLGLVCNSALPSAIFDTLASIFTILIVVPLFRHTTRILMHAAPYGIGATIEARRDAVMKLDGVLHCGDIHIWEEGEGLVVGTICVLVEIHVDKASVLDTTARAFDGIVDDLTIQVESCRSDDDQHRM